MHIVIERVALLKALDNVRSVVAARNTIPILSNIKMVAEEDRLVVTATDLDIECVGRAAADVKTPGAVTAPASTLYDIVRKLPDGSQITLKFNGEDPRLTVSAGRSRFQVPVLLVGDFPEMSADGLSACGDIDCAALARVIDKTSFAMSSEETRYYLKGLYVHAVEVGGVAKLRAVSTDGHRLAMAEMPLPEGLAGMEGIIIPRKTVKEIRKLLDGSTTVRFRASKQKVRLEGTSIITSKVIDGSFPDYTRVVPRDNSRIALADQAVLASAVDRVATISGEKARSTKFAIEPGRLTLTVRNMEAGQATEELEVDYDGPEFQIGFNARYTLDVLSRIDGPQVEFRFGDPASPVLVLDPKDPTSQYVIMPLRV